MRTKNLSVPSHLGYDKNSTSRISNKKNMDRGDKILWESRDNRKKNISNIEFTQAHDELIKNPNNVELRRDMYKHFKQHSDEFSESPKLLKKDFMKRVEAYQNPELDKDSAFKKAFKWMSDGDKINQDQGRKFVPPCSRNQDFDPQWLRDLYDKNK
jgi:hypothetical protein